MNELMKMSVHPYFKRLPLYSMTLALNFIAMESKTLSKFFPLSYYYLSTVFHYRGLSFAFLPRCLPLFCSACARVCMCIYVYVCLCVFLNACLSVCLSTFYDYSSNFFSHV